MWLETCSPLSLSGSVCLCFVVGVCPFPPLFLSALFLSGLNTLTLRQLAPLDKPRDARLELMASIKQPGACIERTTSFPLRLQFSLAASAIKLKIAVNARKIIISDAPQTSRQKDDSVPHCVVTHVKRSLCGPFSPSFSLCLYFS